MSFVFAYSKIQSMFVGCLIGVHGAVWSTERDSEEYWGEEEREGRHSQIGPGDEGIGNHNLLLLVSIYVSDEWDDPVNKSLKTTINSIC